MALSEIDHRAAHVNLDVAKGRRKAGKIRGVIEARRPLTGARLLDAGCGGGTIAAALVDAVGPSGQVVGCDVHARQVPDPGVEFHLLTDDALPFPPGSFDIVVSNHVLEHVGERVAQERYVAEIARVLRPDGLLYLAVPNRWRLIEHHFGLPLLSWLPRRFADAYVRGTRRGTRYDVFAPSHRELEGLLAAEGLEPEDVTFAQMRVMARTEQPRPLVRVLLERTPAWVFRLTRPIIPTMIYLASPRGSDTT
jgi:SAM-dependent methyltransferase